MVEGYRIGDCLAGRAWWCKLPWSLLLTALQSLMKWLAGWMTPGQLAQGPLPIQTEIMHGGRDQSPHARERQTCSGVFVVQSVNVCGILKGATTMNCTCQCAHANAKAAREARRDGC